MATRTCGASAQSRRGVAAINPGTDFTADPEQVRLVVEAERLSVGHLFSPAFATETSAIDPLPHQRIAVYEHMLPQTRLRFLLADDAGAGKTIMTGLYIREMLARRLVRRILVVPPAGLVGNWEREMRTLFSLPFRVVTGGDSRATNPFVGPESNLVIVSVDTLAADRTFARLQEAEVAPYDLAVFDEAHKLSASRDADLTVNKTDRYRLAEALAGVAADEDRWKLSWGSSHLLLLTATPHMGKDYPYYCLWRLLEPEVLSTFDAFTEYPMDARRRHFIRRTKEEMVRYDGTPIYPQRVSDTFSYDLAQGARSEQTLYDETTDYIREHYNKARFLNRSAARLAMSVFQRRLASSTYALLRSLERRLAKLDGWIEGIRSGRVREEALDRQGASKSLFDDMTADEEDALGELEENEAAEDKALSGVSGRTVYELEEERQQVAHLVALAQHVHDQGGESKFEKLRELLEHPDYRDEKMLLFTEHRDTLSFLVRRLEGIGYTGQVAAIHGAMDYREREEQIERFRTPVAEGGAKYLVATDAAGEGVNLQFCWLMVNYDIPWNPARLEQRMGRIHRYLQAHDPVIIANLVAGKTREGRVLRALLQKLERMRKELGSDKVFDVIGYLFEGRSLTDYMEQALTDDDVADRVEGTLTDEQMVALRERERKLFGEGGDVKRELPRLCSTVEREAYLRLLPGYVRRFVGSAAPVLDIAVEGPLDGVFAFGNMKPGALDPLLPVLERYPERRRARLTCARPSPADDAVWLHPGEPVFERLRAMACASFGDDALRGSVFVDPAALRPYMLHFALVSAVRGAAPGLRDFREAEVLEYRLVAVAQDESGSVWQAPAEGLMLLRPGDGVPTACYGFANAVDRLQEEARGYALGRVATPLAEARRQLLLADLPERLDFLRKGYDFQEAELAERRSKLRQKAQAGNARAVADLNAIKERQRVLEYHRDQALAMLEREPDLIAAGEAVFIAHALVVPSSDPEDLRKQDEEVERIAMQVVRAWEEAAGATVFDVSTPPGARAAGLTDWPGFDLLSRRPDGEERAVEVKGRAGVGDVELSENEWVRADNLRARYWLYVVYNCASDAPRLERVQDPFGKGIGRAKGGVVIESARLLEVSSDAD